MENKKIFLTEEQLSYIKEKQLINEFFFRDMYKNYKTFEDYIINEGVFGYEPYDSDGFADMRYEIYNMIFDDITNRFKEVKDNHAPHLWDNIGLALYYTTILANSKEGVGNTDNFKAMDEQVINAFSIIEKDKKWINSWKDPEKIVDNIAKAKKDWENIKKKTY